MNTTNKNPIPFEKLDLNRENGFRPKDSLKKSSYKPVRSIVRSRSLRPHKGLIFSVENKGQVENLKDQD